MASVLESEMGEVLHRAATNFLPAKAAQVLAADAGDGGELIECPHACEVALDMLP